MAKFENLPKWAQNEIVKLRRDVAWYSEQLATAEGDGKIKWRLLRDGGGLPDEATVDFKVQGVTVSIDFDQEKEMLRVIAHDRIAIFPDASNSLKIGVVK